MIRSGVFLVRDKFMKPSLKGLLATLFFLLLAGSSISGAEKDPTLNTYPSTATSTNENVIPIGVILPLTGRYADFGEAVLKGILLGAEVFGSISEGFLPVEIVLRDSQGDPQKAVEAVEELARNEGVIAILGPLLGKTSIPAAKRAEELKLPLITFTQVEGVTGIGDYIFRNSLTPSMQAKAIVKYAVEDLGIRRFGVLHPNTSYGKSLTEYFKAEVKRLGGEIVRVEEYKSHQTDFGENIKRLFLIKEEGVKGAKGKVKGFTPPVIDFEALYIPDYFDRIILIAPQLAFYNIKGIQLLGSNGWNSPKLIEMGERFTEGAIFVDSFFPHSGDAKVTSFVKEFKESFGIEPGILEAQGYDTVRMLLSLIRTEGIREREALKEGLGRIKHFSGITGDTSFNERGEAVKELYILKVEGRRIVLLNP